MQAQRPWRPCSPPAVATRVQTQRARPTAFARPTPIADTDAPLPARSPTPFSEPRPPVRPFPAGRGYRSPPLAPSNPLPPRKAANGALPFSPFFAPILYIRAREDTFRPLGGRGAVRPAEEKRKGGGKRTGWWTFSPHCGKDGGKQIVDKWKIGALFPPPRDERRRSGERCSNSGALNRKSATRRPPTPPHEVAKASIKARKAQPLSTEKPAHRHGNSASNRENTALINKKRAQQARNDREKSQKQLRPSHDNDEGREPAGRDI